MGVPLRSNIFTPGTPEQKYFACFPVQVAVLFSPTDTQFAQAFRDIFLRLDQLTSENVIFFAVLDPPDEWKDDARNKPWWHEYQTRLGRTGFTLDDRVLVKEIARLFGLAWNQLPAIVAGTNLWAGEFISCPTSPWHIERQLAALTRLARQWSEPNIGHIADTLSNMGGRRARYHRTGDKLRNRLHTLYAVLDTTASDRFDLNAYRRILRSELNRIESALGRARRFALSPDGDQGVENETFEEIAEDAAGRLVAPATVASKFIDRFRSPREVTVAEMLEEESLVMIEAALRSGNLLEQIADNVGGVAQLQLLSRRSPKMDDRSDFTPGAQGVWKAFELEINFSIIQACRAARLVKMPDLFTLYDASLPKKLIVAGKDINKLDPKRRTGHHEFLTLGAALNVTRAMSGSPSEDFDKVIIHCIGGPLPLSLLETWKQIKEFRDRGSHAELLSRADYEAVLNLVSPDIFGPLARIKRCLSDRGMSV